MVKRFFLTAVCFALLLPLVPHTRGAPAAQCFEGPFTSVPAGINSAVQLFTIGGGDAASQPVSSTSSAFDDDTAVDAELVLAEEDGEVVWIGSGTVSNGNVQQRACRLPTLKELNVANAGDLRIVLKVNEPVDQLATLNRLRLDIYDDNLQESQCTVDENFRTICPKVLSHELVAASCDVGDQGFYVFRPDTAQAAELQARIGEFGANNLRIGLSVNLSNVDGGFGQEGVEIFYAGSVSPPPAPPANGKIVFESGRDGPNQEIYVTNADGGNPTNISNNPLGDDLDPEWSPDGSKVVFVRSVGTNNEIFVMDAGGGNQTNLTNHPKQDTAPSWSPDGQKIAFVSSRAGNLDVFVMNADGSNPLNLTLNAGNDRHPAWSPDGKRIAFASDRDGDLEIYVADADGTNVIPLTSNAQQDRNPKWSPDGKRIVFASNRDGNDEVYVVNAEGCPPISVRVTSNPASDSTPAWSPDGAKIVFTSNRSGNDEVFIMNPDGSNPINLSQNPAHDSNPYWKASPLTLTLTPNTVTGTKPSTGTIALSQPAPAVGAKINLSSSNTAIATVPASVTITAGATSGTFKVTTKAVANVSASDLSASYDGDIQSAKLTVLPPTLASLTLSPASITGPCEIANGTVKLNAKAPAGGAVVTLTNTNPAAAAPASVTVPAGGTSASFAVSSSLVASKKTGTITASYGGVSLGKSLAALPVGVKTLVLSPNPVVGPNPVTGTVTLACPAPAGGVVIALSSGATSVAKPSALSITIPEGVTTGTFTVTTADVAATATAKITAKANGIAKSVTLTVN